MKTSPQDLHNILLHWKAGLQLEEALLARLIPTPPAVAQTEGRPYCKISYAELPEFEDFALRRTARVSLPLDAERLPFAYYLTRKDEQAKRQRRTIEHDFLLCSPVFFFKDRHHKPKICGLCKFLLADLRYPPSHSPQISTENTTDTKEASPADLPVCQLEQELPESGSAPLSIDDFVLEELLCIDTEEVADLRRSCRSLRDAEEVLDRLAEFFEGKLTSGLTPPAADTAKESPRSSAHQRLCTALTAFIDQGGERIGNTGQNRLKGSLRVYPYHLLYLLEGGQPTRQLCNDLAEIIDEDILHDVSTVHPAQIYLGAGQSDTQKERQDNPPLLANANSIPATPNQKAVLASVLDRPFSLIHGPPGTGKTYLIAAIAANRIIKSVQASDDYGVKMAHTLVASVNNKAVDQAIASLHRDDLFPVSLRLGNFQKMVQVSLPQLKAAILMLIERDPATEKKRYAQLSQELKQACQPGDTPKKAHTDPHELYLLARRVHDAHMGMLQEEVIMLLEKMCEEIADFRGLRCLYKGANQRLLMRIFPVIGCTLLSVRNIYRMKPESYGMTIIDEAGQCMPPYALPALLRSQVAVMIGDLCQIEPITTLHEQDWQSLPLAQTNGLSGKLQERFLSSVENTLSAHSLSTSHVSAEESMTLSDHFRSHPNIIGVCAELSDYDLSICTPPPPDYLLLAEHALWYQDIVRPEQRNASSWCNLGEAEVVIALVLRLLQAGVSVGDIAVLTPYAGQFRHLRAEFRKRSLPIADEGVIANDAGVPPRANARRGSEANAQTTDTGITLGTLHLFQGGEKNIVLFSPVIANGQPNFLNSRVNILNVAVSRARHRFVVVGSLAALERGQHTRVLHRHLIEHGYPFPAG